MSKKLENAEKKKNARIARVLIISIRKLARLLRRKKHKPIIDRSQLYELERLQMENFPSVREYEMALAEFQRTRCE